MKVLFVSRKRKADVGGLARFATELISRFPNSYLLSPDTAFRILKLPFISIDLIHLCDAALLPLGIFLKFILRKPLTVTAHGLDLTFPNPLYQWMLKTLLPKADAVILDSEAARSHLARLTVGEDKIFIIDPGIAVLQFVHPDRIELPDVEGKIVLLTVGNLVTRKGHVWFIKEVLRNYKGNFIYLIVGDGPMKNKIEETIARYNLEKAVYLLGKVPDVQLAYILERADIYVAPNQEERGDFEGFGIAAGEAAAMGLPVIASDVDGLPDVIRDGYNGILVKPRPDQFLSAIQRLKNPKIRREIGNKAKLYTQKNYSWQKTANAYLKVFEGLLRKN